MGVVTREGEPVEACVELRRLGAPSPPWWEHQESNRFRPPLPDLPSADSRNTGPDGAFRFPGLSPGDYEIRVQIDDCLAARAITLSVAGARMDASIDVPAAGPPRQGRAVTDGGRPFVGLVWAGRPYPHDESTVLGRPATTDAEGRFVLAGVGSADIRLSARGADGLLIRTFRPRLPGDGEMLFSVGPIDEVSCGRVVSDSDGKPVPGARIVARSDQDGTVGVIVTTTDADGKFSIRGTARIDVSADGYAPTRTTVRAAPVANEVRLLPPASLRGRVVSAADGTPLPAMAVRLVMDPLPSACGRSSVTDADGRFVIDGLPVGEATVVARGAGWSSERAIGRVLLASGCPAEIVLAAVPAACVTGGVRGADGEGVAGAVVVARPVLRSTSRTRVTVAADGDGRFLLRDLTPLVRYRVEVSAPGGMTTGRLVTLLPLPGESISLDLSVRPKVREVWSAPEATAPSLAATLGGAPEETEPIGFKFRILDPAGRPVPLARVSIHVSGEPGFEDTEDVCGGSGVIHPLIPPGRRLTGYEVYDARDATGRPLPLGSFCSLDVPTAGEEIVVHLPVGDVIRGSVRNLDGAGVAGVVVKATMAEGGRAVQARTVTDLTGAFLLTGLSPRDYDLSVEPEEPWGAPKPMRVAAGEEAAAITLRRGRSVLLRIVGPDGQPPRGAEVTMAEMIRGGRAVRSVRNEWADARGLVLFEGLTDRRPRWLYVDPFGRELLPRGIEDWVPADTTIVLDKAQTVAGRVLDPSGTPLPGIRVHACGAVGTLESDTSKEDGTFRIDGLHAGTVKVWATTELETSETAEVEAGATGVEIRVDPGIELLVSVSGSTEDHDGFECHLFLGEKTWRHWMPGGEAVTAPGVKAAGVYRIWIGSTDDGLVGYRENVPGNSGKVTIALTPGKVMRGRIKLPARVSRVWITAGIGDHEVFGTADSDGNFVIEGLPDTELTVKAEVALEGGRRLHATVKAVPGDSITLIPR